MSDDTRRLASMRFNGLSLFVDNYYGTGVVDWGSVSQWAKYIHLSDGIIITEDAV